MPNSTTAEPTWRLRHRGQVGAGAAAVVLYEVVDIRPDGSIAQAQPPDLSWNHGHAADPAVAAQLAANLVTATGLITTART